MNRHQFLSYLQRQRLSTVKVVLLSSLLAVSVVGLVSGAAQSPRKEEREIEDKIPAHLPIKVRVKNPEKVKDLKDDKWMRNLEIEVTNTGNKSIYFLSIVLHLSDVKGDNGTPIGYPLWYGRNELIDFSNPVLPDDVPIGPGESHTFKIPENWAGGWELFKARKRIANPKKIDFVFQVLNFGDGTGFMLPSGKAIPDKVTFNVRCREGSETSHAATASDPPSFSLHKSSDHLSMSNLPARFLPVSFYPAVAVDVAPEPAIRPDICCPGTSCSHNKPAFVTCVCGQQITTASAACTDPFGTCSIDVHQQVTCRDSTGTLDLVCDFDELGDCAAPTPTPSPTPTPDCDPHRLTRSRWRA